MKNDNNSNEHTTKGLCPNPMSERAPSTTKRNAIPENGVITNCQQLRQAIAKGCFEFRLMLCGGAYSRKHITQGDHGRFHVFNYIDDSVQKLTSKQLFTQSNIGEAMSAGAFVMERQNNE